MREEERETRVDSLKVALEKFDKQASSAYDPEALKQALEDVRKAGSRHKRPGELYADLANLSAIAVDLAEEHGQEEDRLSFAELQGDFQRTSDLIEGGGLILPGSPSQPRRTTGRAAG